MKHDRISKTNKKSQKAQFILDHEKAVKEINELKRKLSASAKKPRVKKLSDKRARQVGLAMDSLKEWMEVPTVRKDSRLKQLFLNNEPLLGKSKTKRPMGRGKPRRSMLRVSPKMGKDEKEQIQAVHDKKVRPGEVRFVKNESIKHNKVHKSRSKAPYKPIRTKAKRVISYSQNENKEVIIYYRD